MSKFTFYIIKILSFSPFLTVSDDARFGQIGKNSSEYRKSMLSFKIGIKAFYIVTFDHFKKFKLIHTIDLYDVQKYEDNIAINGDKYDVYKIDLAAKKEKSILSERDYINYKISEIVNTKNKTFNKFLAYIAILAFLLPLFTPKILDLWIYIKSYKLIFIIAISYIFLNVFFLSVTFIRVKEFTRTIFKSIQNSTMPAKELNALLFYEWRNLQIESVFEVAVIKNLEKYMASIILWGIIIIACINVEDAIKTQKIVDSSNGNIQAHSEVIIFRNEVDFNSMLKSNDVKINKITEGILNNEYETIVIISKENNYISDNLLKLFEFYNNGETSIIGIKNQDYNDQIEIILLEK